jgi:CDP-diacylglycerol--glycerol-3-phosphate 3-phosphatidyltransferase
MNRDYLKLPNLLSLSRIFIAPIIGFFLWRGDADSAVVALVLIIVAGITDGLDGFIARRLNMVSDLGVALDPIADKVFAALLVIFLIMFRDLPLWLAVVIIGRDLLILAGGLILRQGRTISLPSNIPGKYAFAAIAVLLASYVIWFDFGVELMTDISLVLIVWSLISYGRVFWKIRKGETPSVFKDKPIFRTLRVAVAVVVAVIFFVKLYSYFGYS